MPKRIIIISSSILFLLILVFLAIYGRGLNLVYGFSRESNEILNEKEIDEYTVQLVDNQAWSGPGNYRYILRKGLFNTRIGISYSGTTLDDDDVCIIVFKEGEGLSDKDKENYIFDKCENTIKRIE